MTSAISGEILHSDRDCLIIYIPSVLGCDLADVDGPALDE